LPSGASDVSGLRGSSLESASRVLKSIVDGVESVAARLRGESSSGRLWADGGTFRSRRGRHLGEEENGVGTWKVSLGLRFRGRISLLVIYQVPGEVDRNSGEVKLGGCALRDLKEKNLEDSGKLL